MKVQAAARTREPVAEAGEPTHDPPKLANEARPLLSLLVVGCGVLIVVSYLVPLFEPPFAGTWYMQSLAGVTCVLGGLALLRGERGGVARVALVVTLSSAALFLFTIVFPWAYSAAMGALMPD